MKQNIDYNNAGCDKQTHEEKNRLLFFRQKEMLDMFLQKGAITKVQHDKSLHDLTVKMGQIEENKDDAY